MFSPLTVLCPRWSFRIHDTWFCSDSPIIKSDKCMIIIKHKMKLMFLFLKATYYQMARNINMKLPSTDDSNELNCFHFKHSDATKLTPFLKREEKVGSG
jgi:hypothetical protein